MGKLKTSIENVMCITAETLLKYAEREENAENLEQIVNGAANLLKGIVTANASIPTTANSSFIPELLDKTYCDMVQDFPILIEMTNSSELNFAFEAVVEEYIEEEEFERVETLIKNLWFVFCESFGGRCSNWIDTCVEAKNKVEQKTCDFVWETSEEVAEKSNFWESDEELDWIAEEAEYRHGGYEEEEEKEEEIEYEFEDDEEILSFKRLLEDTFSCLQSDWLSETQWRAALGGLSLAFAFDCKETKSIFRENGYSKYISPAHWEIFCKQLDARLTYVSVLRKKVGVSDQLWNTIIKIL